ncbi:hypothetical protein diail_10207 [Diaporthe ilicicola]|nr:hypothetical protein diail_10207 [Diaporthe ilicicola]
MHHHGSNEAPSPKRPWQDGDIAFLKGYEYFRNKDHENLIASGYVHRSATNHPVIILQAGPGGAIITTISAYNSGPETNFFPPWRMSFHREKLLDDFHAFVGTELPPNSSHNHLKLSDSQAKLNKPKASWVHVKNFWTVPYSVLLRWNKVPGRLQVSKESLAQLNTDIERKYTAQLQDARSRLAPFPSSPGTSQTRQNLRHPRAQRSLYTAYQPQQSAFPKARGSALVTTSPAMRAKYSSPEKKPANCFVTSSPWRQAISTTGESTNSTTHSWRRPIAA